MKNRSILRWALILLSVGLTMCKKEEKAEVELIPEPKPLADFTYQQVSPTDLKTFKFTSTSTNFKQLQWQFGDDSTSALETETHTFQFYGKYKVVLTARNSEGYSARKEIILNLINPAFDSSRVGENYIQIVRGNLTVSRENGGGPNGNEGSQKLIDGNINTKYLWDYPSEGSWIKFEMAQPVVAQAYTISSADDAPSRDGKTWTFQGSNDNLDWVILNTQSKVLWSTVGGSTNRKTNKIFHFNNLNPYKFYRLVFTENNGSNLMQLAEWTINKSQP